MRNSNSSAEPPKNTDVLYNVVKFSQLALVFLCAVAFIVALVIYSSKVRHNTIHYVLEYQIITDSTGIVTADSRQLADSLIGEMQRHDQMLEEKYQYFIEQQSNTQNLLTIGGILLSIVVSLVGFFGYSTMQTIEEKAKKMAEDSAQNAYLSKIKELQDSDNKKYLETTVKPEVDKKIEEAVSKYWDPLRGMVETMETDVTLLKNAVVNIDKKNNKQSRPYEVNDNKPTIVKEPNVFDDIK